MMAVNQNHPSGHMQVAPTLDMPSEFGAGTLRPMTTNAEIAEQELGVRVTSPSMRAAASTGPAYRSEKNGITPQNQTVMVRAANQDPGATVSSAAGKFIWGMGGEGDPSPPQKANLGIIGIGLTVAGGLLLYRWLAKG